MSQQERPAIDRVWEFTKDISVKVSKQAEKHWKINTLRVQIASIKHRKSNSCKELGRFVYESLKSNSVEEDNYKTSLEGFFAEIQDLDHEILERENKIEVLASEQVLATEEEAMPADESTPVAEEEAKDADVVDETPEEETEDSDDKSSKKAAKKSE